MAFAIIAFIVVGLTGHMAFEQGQANPSADGFLDSKSKALE